MFDTQIATPAGDGTPGDIERVKWGPWTGGYTSTVDSHLCPPNMIWGRGEPDGPPRAGGLTVNSSVNMLVDPVTGGIFRRRGSRTATIGTSAITPNIGLLETGMQWSARVRRILPFSSSSNGTASVNPSGSVAILYGNDTNSANFPSVDTGWFGTMYVRNVRSGENYNLLMDLGAAHYPTDGISAFVPTTSGLVVCPPLWYGSGEGGYTRGATQFTRRFITSGSRDALISGNWMCFPNLWATPLRWRQTFNNNSGGATTEMNRFMPTGPFAPLPTISITTPAAAAGNLEAPWLDGDLFYYSCIFRFEDGSFSAPTIPRPVSSYFAAGLYRKAVGTIAGGNKYLYLTWNNIPIGPAGTIERILLRTPKQTRTAGTDAVTVSPFDLRVCGRLTNNVQTSFVDTGGSDTGLIENDDVVRLDTIVPRRARYLGTGDQRVLLGDSLASPHAIQLAVTGYNVSMDANQADDATIGALGAHYRITTTALELYSTPGTGAAPMDLAYTIDWATYTTLQDVVDRINSAVAIGAAPVRYEWKAQLAPGVDGSLPSSYLCPSYRSIANCSTGGVSSATLTATGTDPFKDVPIGAYVYRIGFGTVTAGTYVVSKQSTSSITLSAAMTVAAGTTLAFYSFCGDGTSFQTTSSFYTTAATAATLVVGLMRVFSGAYPGFIYLKRSKCGEEWNQRNRTAIFYTVGSPGAQNAGASLAINCWGADDKLLPSIANSGPILGITDIEGAAFIGYQRGCGLFQNIKGVNSGEDFDYKIFTINSKRGPVSWGAILGGNGWVVYVTREGVFCTDRNRREFNIGKAIYHPGRSGGRGELVTEIKNSVIATDADTDGSYLYLSQMNGEIGLTYGLASPGYAVIRYNYSPGLEGSGVEELANPDTRDAYPWSAPCLYNDTTGAYLVMPTAITTAAGVQIVAANEGNLQVDGNILTTSDGRLDEIDYGDADDTEGGSHPNGVGTMGMFNGPAYCQIAPQRVELVYTYPTTVTGAAPSFRFSRNQQWVNPTTYYFVDQNDAAGDQFQTETTQIKSAYRGPTNVVWFQWLDQAIGYGNGVWTIALEYQRLPK